MLDNNGSAIPSSSTDKTGACQVFDKIGTALLDSIDANFDRDSGSEGGEATDGEILDSLLESSYKPVVPGTGDLRHGTEGWKCLETSFRATAKIMEACGTEFQLRLNSRLLDLIFKGTVHLNRFVREICFLAIGSFCSHLDQPNIVKYSKDIVTALSRGLGDDWSQVNIDQPTFIVFVHQVLMLVL